MNLAVNNFSTGGGSFDFDIIMLTAGFVILLVLGLIGFGASVGSRIFAILVGLAMGGYAYYLNFMFTGTTYRMPVYAYILPILLIVTIVRSAMARKKAAAMEAARANHAADATGWNVAPPPPVVPSAQPAPPQSTTDQAPTA